MPFWRGGRVSGFGPAAADGHAWPQLQCHTIAPALVLLLLPADAYKYDPTFTGLLDNGSSFAEVCDLLRSGAIRLTHGWIETAH